MKTRTFLLTAFTLLAVAGLRAADYPFVEPFALNSVFKPDGVVSLDNVNGAIEIRAWDQNRISISGEKSAKTEEELKQIGLKMDVTDDHATLKVHLPKRSGLRGDSIRASVRFVINVPAGAVIEHIGVVNSAITLEHLQGPVNAESVNGRIEATDLSGHTSLKTVNGTITAQFKSVASGQRLSFETVNGAITVRLPSDAGASVDGDVVNGHIVSDFPLTTTGVIRSRTIKGTIGDGRAHLDAHTVNGGIRIQKI